MSTNPSYLACPTCDTTQGVKLYAEHEPCGREWFAHTADIVTRDLEKERIITAEACRQHERMRAALLAMRDKAENAERDLRRALTWLDTERLDPTERLWVERRKKALDA